MTNYDTEFNRKIKAKMFDIDKAYVKNDMKNYSMITGEGYMGEGVSGGCSTAGVCDCKGSGLSAGVMKYSKKGMGVSGGDVSGGGVSGGMKGSLMTSNAVVKKKGGAIQTSKMSEVKAYNDKLNTEGSTGAGKKKSNPWMDLLAKVKKEHPELKGMKEVIAYIKKNNLYK